MSRWTDLYENHAFNQRWKSLDVLLQEELLPKEADENSVKEVARLRKAFAYVSSFLEGMDPELLSKGILNELSGPAEAAVNEINTFKANKQVAHLQNANNNFDGIINVAQRLPIPHKAKLKQDLPAVVAAYSKDLDQHLQHVKSETEKQLQELQKSSTQTTQDFSALNQKLTNLKNQITTVEQTIQQQTAEFTSQFQSAQTERTNQFNDEKKLKIQEFQKAIEDANQQISKLVETLNTKADERFKELTTKSATILEIMTSHQQNAEQVLGVVINTAQAGAYKSYANEEKSTANIFRWTAFGLMLLGVSIIAGPEIVKILTDIQNYAVDWEKVLWRLPVSAVMFIPAFYLARESDKHRRNEFFNRRRELILCSIDPYLALIDESKRDDLKTELARELFKDSQGIELPAKNVDLGEIFSQVANFLRQVKS